VPWSEEPDGRLTCSTLASPAVMPTPNSGKSAAHGLAAAAGVMVSGVRPAGEASSAGSMLTDSGAKGGASGHPPPTMGIDRPWTSTTAIGVGTVI